MSSAWRDPRRSRSLRRATNSTLVEALPFNAVRQVLGNGAEQSRGDQSACNQRAAASALSSGRGTEQR